MPVENAIAVVTALVEIVQRTEKLLREAMQEAIRVGAEAEAVMTVDTHVVTEEVMEISIVAAPVVAEIALGRVLLANTIVLAKTIAIVTVMTAATFEIGMMTDTEGAVRLSGILPPS